jgi:uncharacterized membrane protein YcaP (DUF421 family)
LDGRQKQGHRLSEHAEKRGNHGNRELKEPGRDSRPSAVPQLSRLRFEGKGFPGTHALLEIVARTAIIYLVVLLGVRLSGKREVGQITPFDLTLLLLISNSVQNAMTGPDTSILGGIAAALTLLGLNYFVAEVSGGNRRFRKLVQGQPSLLIHDEQIITTHMAKEHVSMDELNRALREHGIATHQDVALAVLEVDGSISCLKYDEIKPTATHLVHKKFLQKHE